MGNTMRDCVIRECRSEEVGAVLELWRQADATPSVTDNLVPEVEKRLARQGARRITALVEKDHPWATSFWQAVGYGLDSRIVRHVRNL
jgi:hypothetical protein